jgi:hypothetical protein
MKEGEKGRLGFQTWVRIFGMLQCLRPSSRNLRCECWRLLGVAGLGMFRSPGGRQRLVYIPISSCHENFPYGRNIAVVVSAVMDKDRQDATRKRRAFARIGDPSREVKKARGVAKSAVSGSSKPPLVAKPDAPGPSRPSQGAQSVASDSGKLLPTEAT